MDRDLRFITQFETFNVNCISWRKVFEYFLFGTEKILYVVDDFGKLSGIITLGDFIHNLDRINNAVNKECFSILHDSEAIMFSKAQEIYDTYGIETDIPVVDDKKTIVGYISDCKAYSDRKISYEKEIEEAKNKIRNFKKSYYLKKEIAAFYDILEKTEIYVRKSEVFQEIFSLFDEKIKITVLSDEEYGCKLEKMIRNKENLTDEEKKELIFDFEFGNGCILYDNPEIISIYSLKKFLFEFTMLVENEEFSRMIRITRSSPYQLKDFIYDNDMREIRFSANKLLSKYVSDYMAENQIPITLVLSDSISVINASFQVNGSRGNSKDAIGFSSCDLAEQYITKKMLEGKEVYVFNIRSAVNAVMTESEENARKNYRILETLIENQDHVELEKMYKDDCKEKTPYEYAKDILHPYSVKRRIENDIIVNADYTSTYVNIQNGIRRTSYQPEEYRNTIYFIGPCIALGPYVEDSHTISSLLAKKLLENEYSYRTVNLGMLASNNNEELLNQLSLVDGDIIINMIYTEKDERIGKLMEDLIDPSPAFNAISDREDMFFDKSVHCNRKGNEVYANVIYEHIKKVLKKDIDKPLKKCHIFDVYKTNFKDLDVYDFQEYRNKLYKEKLKVPKTVKDIGSIVMNCNPFTLGHQYLVEYALQHCDYLFVFVVQEEKSFFTFEDRFAIAAENCKQYDNVSVIPSGQLMASSITFPEYFKREVIRENARFTLKEMKVTPVVDLRIFANYIAPVLGIKKRFIAEEPIDFITKQYNQYVKEVLAIFDIEVHEITRKTLLNGEIVSASKVRQDYRKGNYEKMREMLPDITYNYLINKIKEKN